MDQQLPDPFVSHQGQPQQQQPQAFNMNRINPPPFQLQQSRQGSGTMNELDALRVHSIELETELRLIKEQLLQAQSGTQYLVNCFAGQQARGLVQGMGQNHFALEDHNRQLQTEIHRLRGQIQFQERSRVASPARWTERDQGWGARGGGGWGKSRMQELEDEVEKLKEQRESLLDNVLTVLKEDSYVYRLQFSHGDPAKYSPLEFFKDKESGYVGKNNSASNSNPHEQLRKLGSPFNDTAGKKDDRVDSHTASPTPLVEKHPIFIKQNDIALLDLESAEKVKYDDYAARQDANTHAHIISPTHDPNGGAATNANVDSQFAQPFALRGSSLPLHLRHHRRQEGPPPFQPFEHNHLMSNATFIEDKDAEEYLEFWESLEGDVRRFAGRHTKEEWKMYYETHVRPVYLKKMEQRAGPVLYDIAREKARQQVESSVKQANTAVKEDEIKDKVEETLTVPDAGATTTRTSAQESNENASEMQARADNVQADTAQNSIKSDGLASSQDLLSPKTRPAERPKDVTMPAVPASGSFDLLPSSQVASAVNVVPLPGLAGGWPKPPSRRSTRFPTGPGPATAEKDPVMWNLLFFQVERKSDKAFVLGKNEHLFRTVIITGVPVGTTLAQVVDNICGGKIVGVKFLDTAGMRTKPPVTTNTVIVEFLGSKRAKAFVKHCEKHPITFGAEEASQAEAGVQLICTQTRPLPPAMQADLHRIEGTLTRVFFVILLDQSKNCSGPEIAREIKAFTLRAGFTDVPKNPLSITSDGEMLLFEYADVRQAAAAWNAVASLEWKFGEVSKGFAADPCARQFEKVERDEDARARDVESGIAEVEQAVTGEGTGNEEFGVQGGDKELEVEGEAKWREG